MSIWECSLNSEIIQVYRCDPSYTGIDGMCIRTELIQGSNICTCVYTFKLVVPGVGRRPVLAGQVLYH